MACAKSQARVSDVQQLTSRLQGTWLLQSYRSTVSVELALQALLLSQFGKMQVRVDGSNITATGPGIQVTRSYQIQEIVDETATLVVAEPTGVTGRVWIEFRDNSLVFRPLDGPWNGEGLLIRVK